MKIRYNKGDKENIGTVGITCKSVYITHRKPIHYFRKFSGFACSLNILNHQLGNKIKQILIIYSGTKGTKYFLSDISQWYSAESYENVLGSEGTVDIQKVLPQSEMRVYDSLDDVPEPEEVSELAGDRFR